MTQENSLNPNQLLTAEEIILWLEGYREWMFEIWKNQPELYEIWKKINQEK